MCLSAGSLGWPLLGVTPAFILAEYSARSLIVVRGEVQHGVGRDEQGPASSKTRMPIAPRVVTSRKMGHQSREAPSQSGRREAAGVAAGSSDGLDGLITVFLFFLIY